MSLLPNVRDTYKLFKQVLFQKLSGQIRIPGCSILMKLTFSSLWVWVIWSKALLHWEQEEPIIWNSRNEFNQMNKSNLDSNNMKKTKGRLSQNPPCGTHLNLNFSHGRDENILLPRSFINYVRFLLALAFLHICQLEKLTSLLFDEKKIKIKVLVIL